MNVSPSTDSQRRSGQFRRPHWRWIALGASSLLLATVSGAVAQADSNQQYTGCLKNGNLTQVALGSVPDSPCKSGSAQISWSQTGPAGPAGPAGAIGPQGPAGADGAPGAVPLVSAVPTGDTVCPNGGQRISSGATTGEVCNGTGSYTAMWNPSWTSDGSTSVTLTAHPTVADGSTVTPDYGVMHLTGDASSCDYLIVYVEVGPDVVFDFTQSPPIASPKDYAFPLTHTITSTFDGGLPQVHALCTGPTPVQNHPVPSFSLEVIFTVTPAVPTVTLR